MRPEVREREVLLRISSLEGETGELKQLRVDVTLYGLPAAVVEKCAELRQCPKTEVVRELIEDAVRNRTVFEAGG